MSPIPWFKVDDTFHSHPKVLSIPRGAARLRAVGLWTALGAWCASQLTDGRFARQMVDEMGGTRADAQRLVAAGLWEETPDGYLFHDWSDWQPTRAAVEADREAARQRMARNRAKKSRSAEGVRANADRTSEPVRLTPTRPDPTNAAAAALPTPLPPPLEILRRKLEAARLVVRWDGLTPDQHTEIADLIDLHGDGPLVQAAVRAYRPDAPAAFAQAWLGAWRQLTPPGTGLRAVDPPCTEAGHSGTSKHCAQCASERLAGGDR